MDDRPRREARLPRSFTSRVVGVTFAPGYPESLGQLDLYVRRHLLTGQKRSDGMEPIPAVLIRNPDNAHDPNAIEVHVPAIGHQIGHVQAHTARLLAPAMDGGDVYRAWVVEVVTRDDRPDKPGIQVRIERVEASGPDGPGGGL
jgi:hypothetical protein